LPSRRLGGGTNLYPVGSTKDNNSVIVKLGEDGQWNKEFINDFDWYIMFKNKNLMANAAPRFESILSIVFIFITLSLLGQFLLPAHKVRHLPQGERDHGLYDDTPWDTTSG